MKHHSFGSLGLSDPLLRALETIGYQTPTPIQAQAVPHLLAGSDLLGVAQTGTGKTAAFGLPLLQRLADPSRKAAGRPRALILAPTRELALQIDVELGAFGRHLPLTHAVIFGGVGQRPQIDALRRGTDVLVATPGRLLDLMGQGHADLSHVEILVLDEADRLLDMGFIRDVQRIVRRTPRERQSLLFSATMPKAVASLAAEMLRHPVRVDVSPGAATVEQIEQRLIRAETAEKRSVLEHLLRGESVSRAIVFTRTKHRANRVAGHLMEAGIGAQAIHGNKSQGARQRALQSFKDGSSWVLVATDIAARGIDVHGVSHVINYELPDEPESYVHRIGRTGRAGAGGVAWSLVDSSEVGRLRGIERLVGRIPDEATVALSRQPAEVDQGRSGQQLRSGGQQPRGGQPSSRGGQQPRGGQKSRDLRKSRGGQQSRAGRQSQNGQPSRGRQRKAI